IAPFPGDAPGVQVGVADLAGNGRGLILAGATTGARPRLALVDPLSGAVTQSFVRGVGQQNGLRVAAGDLDGDGRDELVLASGWGGDGLVTIFDRRLAEFGTFAAYPWSGWGMNVAVAARIGLPIAADAR